MNQNIVDGSLLKLLITNGTIALRNDHQRINELNVFPVPDGDTGSNMQSTMMSGVKAIAGLETDNIEKVAKALSRGLLMGARGNSGVILSQLFSGFAKTFKDLETATTLDFVDGLIQGVKQAYSAVINPVEGTILTVAREAADVALKNAKDDDDLLKVLDAYIVESYESLERTPDLLPVLKEAGVVDAGAAGMILIIEGFVMALKGEILEDAKFNTVTSVSSQIESYDSEKDFGYCTEFIISLKDGKKFSKDKFIKRISRLGDSLVVVNDEEICKVHIHTKTPGDVLNFGQQYGSFATLKVENMDLQHSETLLHTHNEGEDCGHIHSEMPGFSNKYGIITVVNGTGLKTMFKDMGVSCIIEGGQTMNPSTEDFITAVEAIESDHIIIIPNNGNVLLSAETAAKYLKDRDITVLPAKTIAQGYASLTMFDANQGLEENIKEMTGLVEHVKSGEITYAIRDTEYKGIKITKDDYIGLAEGEIVISNPDRKESVKHLFTKLIDEESEIITIMYGQNVEPTELEEVMLHLEENFNAVEVETIEGNQDIYSYIIAVE